MTKKKPPAPFIQLWFVVVLIESLLISFLPTDTALLLASFKFGIVVGMRDLEQRLIVELVYVFVLCFVVVFGRCMHGLFFIDVLSHRWFAGLWKSTKHARYEVSPVTSRAYKGTPSV